MKTIRYRIKSNSNGTQFRVEQHWRLLCWDRWSHVGPGHLAKAADPDDCDSWIIHDFPSLYAARAWIVTQVEAAKPLRVIEEIQS